MPIAHPVRRSLTLAAMAAAAVLASCAQPPPAADRAEVLIELAHAETAICHNQAVRHLREALDLIPDAPRRAQILLELGWSEHHSGRFRDAADAFERGLALASVVADEDLATRLEAGYLVSATLDSRRVADAVRRIRGSGLTLGYPLRRTRPRLRGSHTSDRAQIGSVAR